VNFFLQILPFCKSLLIEHEISFPKKATFFPINPSFLLESSHYLLFLKIQYILTVSWGLGDESLSERLRWKRNRCSEVIPFLSGKGVDCSLLGTSFATDFQTWILALGHFLRFFASIFSFLSLINFCIRLSLSLSFKGFFSFGSLIFNLPRLFFIFKLIRILGLKEK